MTSHYLVTARRARQWKTALQARLASLRLSIHESKCPSLADTVWHPWRIRRVPGLATAQGTQCATPLADFAAATRPIAQVRLPLANSTRMFRHGSITCVMATHGSASPRACTMALVACNTKYACIRRNEPFQTASSHVKAKPEPMAMPTNRTEVALACSRHASSAQGRHRPRAVNSVRLMAYLSPARTTSTDG